MTSRTTMSVLVMVFISLCLFTSQTMAFDGAIHLGTKTPYRVLSPSFTQQTGTPVGCKLVHHNLLARHGTRYPSRSDSDKFSTLEKYLKSNLQNIPDPLIVSWLSNWSNPFSLAKSGLLSAHGMDEHFNMGQRFSSQYRELYGDMGYDSTKTIFQNTQVERTALSAQSFGYGLYNQRGTVGSSRYSPIYSYNLPPSNDVELRPFDTCPSYDKWLVEDTSKIALEKELWIQDKFPAITERIENILGIKLNTSQTFTMMGICAFEYSLFNQSGHFCSLFEIDDLKSYEYAIDLEIYWERSYGYRQAVQLASPLLNDFIFQIERTIKSIISKTTNGKSPKNLIDIPTAKMRFAHAETLIPLVSILGLFKDPYPLKANLPPQDIANRKFISSVVSPFAGNLQLLTYDCQNSSKSESERFFVKLLHNEAELVIPKCSKPTSISGSQYLYCGFDDFKASLKTELQLQFESMCEVPVHSKTANSEIMLKRPLFYFMIITCTVLALTLAIWGGVVIVKKRSAKKKKQIYELLDENI